MVKLFFNKGNTPIHMAFKAGCIGIIIDMIHNGGDLNIVNKDGHTPIAFGTEKLLR